MLAGEVAGPVRHVEDQPVHLWRCGPVLEHLGAGPALTQCRGRVQRFVNELFGERSQYAWAH